jgi:hypothetical protein
MAALGAVARDYLRKRSRLPDAKMSMMRRVASA